MSQIRTLFESLQTRFKPSASADLTAVFQYQLKEGEHFHFDINNGQCTLAEGIHESPSVTMKMKFDTLEKLSNGELDGMKALMFGKLKVSGDMMLASRLPHLFPLER